MKRPPKNLNNPIVRMPISKMSEPNLDDVWPRGWDRPVGNMDRANVVPPGLMRREISAGDVVTTRIGEDQ